MARLKKRQKMFGVVTPPSPQLRVPRVRISQSSSKIGPKKLINKDNRFVLLFLFLPIALMAAQVTFESQNKFGKMVVILSGISLVYLLVSRARQSLMRRRWLEGVEMLEIDQMEGHEFEEVCAEIYRRSGYENVTVTKKTRDQGADIIMERSNVRFVVQSKRQASTVGNWAVQEVHTAKSLYNAQHAIVVTNNAYTSQAIELAKACKVELIDRIGLAQMLEVAAKNTRGKPIIQELIDIILQHYSISAIARRCRFF